MFRNSCWGLSFEVISRSSKFLSLWNSIFESLNWKFHQVFLGGVLFLLVFFLLFSLLKLYHILGLQRNYSELSIWGDREVGVRFEFLQLCLELAYPPLLKQ